MNIIFLSIPPVAVGRQIRRIPHNMQNQRMHWAVRNRWNKAWKSAVGWEWIQNRPRNAFKTPKFAKITVILSAVKSYDRDNAYSSVKPLIDGLKEAGAIKDDSEKYINLKVEQAKVNHRIDEKVRIIIEF